MIKKLYISWKKQTGYSRHIVAEISKSSSDYSFSLIDKGFKAARKEGLDYIFGFKNPELVSSDEIENMLLLRIPSKERKDRIEYLKFWEADGYDDPIDILGFTQGKSQTDNFEFLANFLYVKDKKLKFVTDLASLSHIKLPRGTVSIGASLTYSHNSENEFDKYAIDVFLNDIKIGHIKQIHNRIFKKIDSLKLTVKAIEENGFVKQIFVLVEK